MHTHVHTRVRKHTKAMLTVITKLKHPVSREVAQNIITGEGTALTSRQMTLWWLKKNVISLSNIHTYIK